MENAAACGKHMARVVCEAGQNGSLWRTRQCSVRTGTVLRDLAKPGLMLRGQCFPAADVGTSRKNLDYDPPVKNGRFRGGWCLTSIICRKERGETRPSGPKIGTGLKYFRGTEKLRGGYPARP